MAPRCVAALLVVLVAVVQASSEKLINPYVNDYVAVPDVMSMVQMKTGMQAGVKMAATIGANEAVVFDSNVFIRNAVRAGDSVVVEKTIKSTGSVSSDDKLWAKVGVETLGTMTAKSTITSDAELISKGPVTAATGVIKGTLNVAGKTTASEIIEAQKGILSLDIIRSKENIISDKALISTALLQANGGIHSMSTINCDDRISAKKDIFTMSYVTAAEGFVTQKDIAAAGDIRSDKNIRAIGTVTGNLVTAQTGGVVSKGLIHSNQDVKADNVIEGTKGVLSKVDVTAENNLVAKKETNTQTLVVNKGAKILETLDVSGAATFGTATVKGKLYVGDRAISDIVTSMEADMAKMRTELAESRESMRRMMEMMEQRA